jgi:hypothetical protein
MLVTLQQRVKTTVFTLPIGGRARFMASWCNEIVGAEFRMLVTLQKRVKLTLLLIRKLTSFISCSPPS